MADIDFSLLVQRGTRAAQPAATAVKVGALYFVTDEDVTERSTGAAWQAYSPVSGGGGGLILVEKKLLVANATTVTFSSLDGNAHGNYRLMAKIKNVSGSNVFYDMRPNGATTNLHGNFFYIQNTSLVPANGTIIRMGFANADDTWYSLRADMELRKNPNGVASPFTVGGTWSSYDGTNPYQGGFGGEWTETSTNVTSLDIVASAASGIGSGSEFWLYRYAQS